MFDLRWGWLKELHDKKKWIAVKVATAKNLADDMTKPLSPVVRKNLDNELARVKTRVVDAFRGQIGKVI